MILDKYDAKTLARITGLFWLAIDLSKQGIEVDFSRDDTRLIAHLGDSIHGRYRLKIDGVRGISFVNLDNTSFREFELKGLDYLLRAYNVPPIRATFDELGIDRKEFHPAYFRKFDYREYLAA